MTNSWLTALSTSPKTAEEELIDSLTALPEEEMQKLAWENHTSQRPTQLQALREKIAVAERQGRELAHENHHLQKIAFLPAALATAGKAIAKDVAIGAAGNKIMGALKPATPAASAAGEIAGGFKYAFNMSSMGRQAAGFLHRNPGTAMTAGGALLGAAMAPRDPQTGQKQYMRGAVMGGVGAAGINAISGGRMADNMKQMVTRQNNPLLGQNARRYMTESAYATRPKITSATQAPVVNAAPAVGSTYNGGPVTGEIKLASITQQVSGIVKKYPGVSSTMAGAAMGATLAPHDKDTGEKHYLQGALLGGAAGAGIGRLAKGSAGKIPSTSSVASKIPEEFSAAKQVQKPTTTPSVPINNVPETHPSINHPSTFAYDPIEASNRAFQQSKETNVPYTDALKQHMTERATHLSQVNGISPTEAMFRAYDELMTARKNQWKK